MIENVHIEIHQGQFLKYFAFVFQSALCTFVFFCFCIFRFVSFDLCFYSNELCFCSTLAPAVNCSHANYFVLIFLRQQTVFFWQLAWTDYWTQYQLPWTGILLLLFICWQKTCLLFKPYFLLFESFEVREVNQHRLPFKIWIYSKVFVSEFALILVI